MGKLKQRYSNDHNPSQQFLRALKETLSEDPHLTDTELIEWSAGVVAADGAERFRSHISRCGQCAGEVAGMTAHLAEWAETEAMARREELIGRPSVMNAEAASIVTPQAPPKELPWWSAVAGWVSLAPLRPLGAMAAGIEAGVVKFPIYDRDAIVIGLSGVVQRRGKEFYVRVSAAPEALDAYRGRIVELAAVEPESGRALLLRKIGIEQTLLLGTDLQIATHKITARLHT